MSNVKKLMMTAAGGDVLNVEDVFSTILYTGTGSNQTITNGIDLSGEGGMTWIKRRNAADNHQLTDSERGYGQILMPNETNGNQNLTSLFNLSTTNSGFTIGSNNTVINNNGSTYVAWTFRKAPNFFDIVTYTGNGSTQTINHNLGATPGWIIVKRTDTSENWAVYNNYSVNAVAPEDRYMYLNHQNPQGTRTDFWNSSAPTSTSFQVGASETNANNAPYVAYLFADHNGTGTFGPNGDQDIISCGGFQVNSSGIADVDFGFDPQFMILKRADSSNAWWMIDDFRGWLQSQTGSDYSKYVSADSSSAESNIANAEYKTSKGIAPKGTYSSAHFVYMAVGRGTKQPESADEVFAISTQAEVPASSYANKYGYYAGFPVDMAWKNITTGESGINTARLMQGANLRLNTSDSQSGDTSAKFDDMLSYYNQTSVATNRYSWMFKRAAGFFDVVGWAGTSSSTQALNHSLGVAPEMMWVKNRNDTDGWIIYHKDMGNGGGMTFQSISGYLTSSAYWNNTTPSASTFTVGNTLNWSSSFNYIGYLFTTLNGISKVGSYTGNGSSQTIDCGFSSGASFVLVKRYDTTGDWTYWDSKRGIVAGNDISAKINGSGSYIGYADSIDPDNSGFIINQNTTHNANVNNGTYIFYAIAAI